MKYLLQERKKKEGRKGRKAGDKEGKEKKTKHEGKSQITEFQIFLF